jgi:hypothetical protein
MKYFMIGGDKQEYGPVDAELIKQWIREGRANGETLLRAEDETDWKPLGTFADFQIQGGPPPLRSGPPRIPGGRAMFAAEANDVPVSVGHAFARAWHLVGQHFGTVASATLIVWLAFTAAAYMPCLGILSMLFYGPLFGGLYMLFLKLIREGEASPGDMFALTRESAMPLMITGLVSLLLVQFGLLCCLPGVYLQVAWLFSLPLVADRGMGFWDALELSRRTATRHWFKLFALCILAFLPYVVFSSYMLTREINDLSPYSKKLMAVLNDAISTGAPNEQAIKTILEDVNTVERSYASWAFFRQLLLLISIPLGIGSLAFVYEDLFGRKKTDAGS